MALVLAEQNVRKALQVSHRAYVLAQGSVSATGDSATLLDQAHIRESYLGIGQAATFGALVDAADLTEASSPNDRKPPQAAFSMA